MPTQLTPCSLASISPSVSLSLSPLPGSPAAPQTHDALNSPWLFLLTKGRAWQGLVKISLITQKTNCYFSICQVAEDKDVKPRIRVNIRSTVTPVCLCSRQAFQIFFFKSWSNSQRERPVTTSRMFMALAVTASVHIPRPREGAAPTNSRQWVTSDICSPHC